MSVTAVQEHWEGREGTAEIGGRSQARRSFRVIVDHPRTSIPEVLSGVDPNTGERIPVLGEPHPEDFNIYCVSATPVQRNKFLWNVVASYASSQTGYSDNPLDDPAEIEWDSDQFQKPAIADRDGLAIVNAAGDFPDPPPPMDDSRWTCLVRKNIAPAVPTWLSSYRNSLNDATFSVDGKSIAQGCAKLSRISIGTRQKRGAIEFRVLTLCLHIADEGWALDVPNSGFRYKSGSARIQIAFDHLGALTSPFNPDAQLPAAPVPLDSSGSVITNPTSSNVIVLHPNVYKQKDFSALPLT